MALASLMMLIVAGADDPILWALVSTVTLAAVPSSAGDMFGTGTVDMFKHQLLLVIGGAVWDRPYRGVIWICWLGFRGAISNFLIWKVSAAFSGPDVDILSTGSPKAQLILLKNRELLERVNGIEPSS